MGVTGGGCHDLSKYQNDPQVADVFSKIVSGGLQGYEAVMERKEPEKKCPSCDVILEGKEKFCPECGTKMDWTQKQEETN